MIFFQYNNSSYICLSVDCKIQLHGTYSRSKNNYTLYKFRTALATYKVNYIIFFLLTMPFLLYLLCEYGIYIIIMDYESSIIYDIFFRNS